MNLSFFSITGWGIDLDYCDIEWFALETNRDHSVIFWDCIQVLHFRLFCWPWWLLHFFWGIPAHSSRYNGQSELNSPIPVHFSLLIPRMSTFALAISCLTTSNFLWFMDWHSRFLCNIALYSIGPCFYHQSHPQLGIVFALAPSLHSFWSYFSTDLQ